MSDARRRFGPPDGPGRREPGGPAAGPSERPSFSPPRPCPACGSLQASDDGAVPASAGGGVSTIRCGGCGLVFVDPVPPEATRPETYGSDYYEPWQGREERLRIRLWRRRLALVEERAAHGSLLDVGCGDGQFLAIARDAGWRVEGIEFSPEGARRASKRLGRPVAVGHLARERLLRGPFDVLTLWHVLEHLEEPGSMLDAARDRLRPGGLLVVAVPNLDNRPMQWAYRLARGRRLPLYETGAREPHLSHFSPPVLEAFLERRRFESIEIVTDRCALTLAKRLIDAGAALLSLVARRLLTDAFVAFARRPR